MTFSDWIGLIPAGLAAIAAAASAWAAVLLLTISRRTADATDQAAAAQHRSAEATDALRLIEIERGHGELAPRVSLALAGRIRTIRIENESWRGYKVDVTVVTKSGREYPGPVLDLLTRGTAQFAPLPAGSDWSAELEDAVLVLKYRADDLWQCPCARPNDYGHWRERRQVPTVPPRPVVVVR